MDRIQDILREVDRLRFLNCAACVTEDPCLWWDNNNHHMCKCFDAKTSVIVFFKDAIRNLNIHNEDGLEEAVVAEAERRKKLQ